MPDKQEKENLGIEALFIPEFKELLSRKMLLIYTLSILAISIAISGAKVLSSRDKELGDLKERISDLIFTKINSVLSGLNENGELRLQLNYIVEESSTSLQTSEMGSILIKNGRIIIDPRTNNEILRGDFLRKVLDWLENPKLQQVLLLGQSIDSLGDITIDRFYFDIDARFKFHGESAKELATFIFGPTVNLNNINELELRVLNNRNFSSTVEIVIDQYPVARISEDRGFVDKTRVFTSENDEVILENTKTLARRLLGVSLSDQTSLLEDSTS